MGEVEKAETAMRAELEHSRQEYNQFMESSKRAMKFEQQERDVLEGLVHVENQLQSDFLNECTPHQGNGKILFTEYKGEPKGGDSLDQMIMSRRGGRRRMLTPSIACTRMSAAICSGLSLEPRRGNADMAVLTCVRSRQPFPCRCNCKFSPWPAVRPAVQPAGQAVPAAECT